MLTNKIILITGASRGIGREVAKALANQGATTILLSRTIADLEALHDEIVAANAPAPGIYPFNLCSATAEDYDDLRRNIGKHYGRLDGLILNAGILGDLTPIEHYNLQTWFRVLQVNLNSQFLLTQACLPLLKQAPSASIVFTLSSQCTEPKANWGAYAVANAGSHSLMQLLASECEHLTNIRVNAVQPKATPTRLYAEAFPAKRLSSSGICKELVSTYCYLMSDKSANICAKIFNDEPQGQTKFGRARFDSAAGS